MDRNLNQYFKDCLAEGKIDFKLRATYDYKGRMTFYLYPEGGGDTIDYIIEDNQLTNRFEWNEELQGWKTKD